MNPSIFEPLSHRSDYLPFFIVGFGLMLIAIVAIFMSLGASMARDSRESNRSFVFGVMFGILGVAVALSTFAVQNQQVATVQTAFRSAVAKTYGVQLDGAQAAELVQGQYNSSNYSNPANGTRYGKAETAVKGQPVDLVLYYADGQYRLASSAKLQELPRRSA